MKEVSESKLEKSIIQWFLQHCKVENICLQLTNTNVIMREYSGAGFFYHFEIQNSDLKVNYSEIGNKNYIDGCWIRLRSGKSIKAQAILFLKEGLIDFIEVYTLEGDIPELVEDFSLE